jgi:hypothetical protein
MLPFISHFLPVGKTKRIEKKKRRPARRKSAALVFVFLTVLPEKDARNR